jgi:hypothetical protein
MFITSMLVMNTGSLSPRIYDGRASSRTANDSGSVYLAGHARVGCLRWCPAADGGSQYAGPSVLFTYYGRKCPERVFDALAHYFELS